MVSKRNTCEAATIHSQGKCDWSCRVAACVECVRCAGVNELAGARRVQLPLVTHKAGAIGRVTASRVCGTVLGGGGTLFAGIALRVAEQTRL